MASRAALVLAGRPIAQGVYCTCGGRGCVWGATGCAMAPSAREAGSAGVRRMSMRSAVRGLSWSPRASGCALRLALMPGYLASRCARITGAVRVLSASAIQRGHPSIHAVGRQYRFQGGGGSLPCARRHRSAPAQRPGDPRALWGQEAQAFERVGLMRRVGLMAGGGVCARQRGPDRGCGSPVFLLLLR